MMGNAMPFVMPFVVLYYYGLACFVTVLLGLLLLREFGKSYKPTKDEQREGQYTYTERNNQKYVSLRYVWPKSCHPPALSDKTVIFCIVPHGVAPMGVCAYPLFSKLWNSKLCHWTAAEVVFELPVT